MRQAPEYIKIEGVNGISEQKREGIAEKDEDIG